MEQSADKDCYNLQLSYAIKNAPYRKLDNNRENSN